MPKVLSDWYYCSTRFLLFATFLLPAVAMVPEQFAARSARVLPALGLGLSAVVLACQVPVVVALGNQIASVVDVGASLPEGSKVVPIDMENHQWGMLNKPQPTGHAWAWLVATRNALASQILAAGKPRMGGDRFRLLSFRPGVLDVPTGSLPWSWFEGGHDISRACEAAASTACRDALTKRHAALDPVLDRYDGLLLLSPPEVARASLGRDLRLQGHAGDVWLYTHGGTTSGR
jgi:hypothetical protein